MNEIQKKLDTAYNVLSRVSVSGESVDMMATAKSILRDAYKTAGDKSALWEAHKLAEKAEEKVDKNG